VPHAATEPGTIESRAFPKEKSSTLLLPDVRLAEDLLVKLHCLGKPSKTARRKSSSQHPPLQTPVSKPGPFPEANKTCP